MGYEVKIHGVGNRPPRLLKVDFEAFIQGLYFHPVEYVRDEVNRI